MLVFDPWWKLEQYYCSIHPSKIFVFSGGSLGCMTIERVMNSNEKGLEGEYRISAGQTILKLSCRSSKWNGNILYKVVVIKSNGDECPKKCKIRVLENSWAVWWERAWIPCSTITWETCNTCTNIIQSILDDYYPLQRYIVKFQVHRSAPHRPDWAHVGNVIKTTLTTRTS